MKQKGIAPILIVILLATVLLLGGLLIYNLQTKSAPSPQKINIVIQSPSPTLSSTPESTSSADISNWKTYTNRDFGYSIRYPANWYLASFEGNRRIEITNYLETQVTQQEKQRTYLDPDKINITLNLYENALIIAGSQSLLDWLKTTRNYESAMVGKPLSEEKTVIAGQPALKLTYQTGPLYVLNNDRDVFYIYYTPTDSIHTSLFHQILSTLNLFDKKQIVDTSNWKIYASKDKTFSFRYPFEWVYEEKETIFEIRGKKYDGYYFTAGPPLTEEQRKMQGYIDVAKSPKTSSNFSLLYMTSPDFQNLNLDNLFKETILTFTIDENIEYSKDILLGNNLPAREVGYGCQAYCIDILFKHGNTIFQSGTGPNALANITTLRQILSTFKFTQ